MRASSSRRAGVVVLLVLAAAVATYIWTTATSFQATDVPARTQTYPRLADAFLHGQLSLRTPVPRGLLRLRDPYDPVANIPYRVGTIHDLTLYHGRFYAYWGPLPALFLMVPQAVGLDVNQAWLVLAFSIGVLLLSVLTLRDVVAMAGIRRRPWMDAVAVAALAWSGVTMFNLRRPAQYEVALACGVFFVLLGTYLVVRVMRGTGPKHGLLWASVAFGCAVLCRLSLVFAAVLLLVPLLSGIQGGWRERATAVARRWTIFVPVAGAIALFALYNLARFGSPTEFGLEYQLSSIVLNEHPYGRLGYLVPGLWYYVFAPPLLRLHFPFVILPPPPKFWGPTPSTYEITDLVAGIVWCTPVVFLVFALPWVRSRARPVAGVLLGLVVAGVLLLLFDAFYVWNAEMRYEVEFLSLLLIAALAAWLVVGSGRTRGQRLIRRVGAILIAIGIFVGLAISINGQDPSLKGEALQRTRPGIFRSLRHFFSPIPAFAATIAGHPLITALNGHGVYRQRYDELAISKPSFILGDTPVVVEVAAPSSRVYALSGTLDRGPALAPGGTAAMTVSVGGRAVSTIPVSGQRFSVNVPLNHGVSDVTLSLVAEPHPPASEGDHFSDVRDLEVR